MNMENRQMSERSVVERVTRETRIRLEVQRGEGKGDVETGVSFLDHMMVTFARYAGLDVTLRARGDLGHHIIEDVAIAMGAAVTGVIGQSAARYGERTIPMDDALVQACVDMGGRPFYRGPLPSSLYDHWMRSFADNAKATVHLRVLRGTDRHHIIEAAFKALGLAIRDAMRDTGADAVFSTKGSVSLDVK
jgi:imidazoleglycerol-phosphate dehydratase